MGKEKTNTVVEAVPEVVIEDIPVRLSLEEWNLIAKRLDSITPVFYMMWKLGRPFFSKKEPTLSVGFDANGQCIDFLINPDFWNIMDEEQQSFLIAHECMHVILNHGIRIQSIMGDDVHVEMANWAMDIVVNELLIRKCFSLSKLGEFKDKLCWIHTCFGNPDTILSGQNFEYYYNRLLQENKIDGKKIEYKKQKVQRSNGGLGSGGGTPQNQTPQESPPNAPGANDQKAQNSENKNKPVVIDSHAGLWDKNAKWEELDEFFDQVSQGCSTESLEEFIGEVKDIICKSEMGGKQAGRFPGGGFLIVNLGKVKKKKKWETVINKWATRYLKEADKDHEQWARLNRRFQLMDGNMFIPTEIEIEDVNEEEKKIEVWFFQDTSGSCAHLAPRFFKAAKSLPPNRFKVRMFCFDTQVYETTLVSGKLYGFGGTSFSCIENKIQEIMAKEKLQYPKAVFVITDGYGDSVSPKFPKKWYWFLSCDFKPYIPKESKTFKLTDFE